MFEQIKIPIQVQASLALLSAQICFSGWHVVGSVAFRGGTNPIIFIFYRLIIGTALMHLYIKYYQMNTFIDPVDHKRLIASGMLSFMNVLCGSLSLKFIAPSRFAIFQPCIPCIVTSISMVLHLEAISNMKLLGIGLAVAGAFIAELWKVGGSDSADEENVPLGVFLAIAQVTAMGSLQVVVKPLLNKYDSAVVSGMYFIVSCMAITVLVFCRIDIIPPMDFVFDNQALAWLALLYVAIFATMYSFSAINWGGKHLPPTVTAVFFTFQPVGTIILSAMLLGAVVTIPEVLGGLLIIAGLIVTSVAQYKSPRQQALSDSDEFGEDYIVESPVHSSDSSSHHSSGRPEIMLVPLREVEFKVRSRTRSAGSTGGVGVGIGGSASYNPLFVEQPDSNMSSPNHSVIMQGYNNSNSNLSSHHQQQGEVNSSSSGGGGIRSRTNSMVSTGDTANVATGIVYTSV